MHSAAAPRRYQAALARAKSKPQGVLGSKAMPKPKETSSKYNLRSNKTFTRFLDLPAELRDNVYQLVLESEPTVHMSKRFPGYLITQSALTRVSRAIREEFLSTVHRHADRIKAHVIDFDFQHIVAFLNRLSENEVKRLVEGPWSRRVKIELDFSEALDLGRCSKDIALLRRWTNRLAHPSKKGTKIVASYGMAFDLSRYRRMELGWIPSARFPTSAKLRSTRRLGGPYRSGSFDNDS